MDSDLELTGKQKPRSDSGLQARLNEIEEVFLSAGDVDDPKHPDPLLPWRVNTGNEWRPLFWNAHDAPGSHAVKEPSCPSLCSKATTHTAPSEFPEGLSGRSVVASSSSKTVDGVISITPKPSTVEGRPLSTSDRLPNVPNEGSFVPAPKGIASKAHSAIKEESADADMETDWETDIEDAPPSTLIDLESRVDNLCHIRNSYEGSLARSLAWLAHSTGNLSLAARAFIKKHGSDQGSEQSSASSGLSHSLSGSSTSREAMSGKRPLAQQVDGHGADGDEDDVDRNPKRSRDGLGSRVEPPKSRRYACPFQKAQQLRGCEGFPCAAPKKTNPDGGYESFARVNTETEAKQHRSANTCFLAQPGPRDTLLTLDQVAELKKQRYTKGTNDQKWDRLFSYLFPEFTKNGPVSPCLDPEWAWLFTPEALGQQSALNPPTTTTMHEPSFSETMDSILMNHVSNAGGDQSLETSSWQINVAMTSPEYPPPHFAQAGSASNHGLTSTPSYPAVDLLALPPSNHQVAGESDVVAVLRGSNQQLRSENDHLRSTIQTGRRAIENSLAYVTRIEDKLESFAVQLHSEGRSTKEVEELIRTMTELRKALISRNGSWYQALKFDPEKENLATCTPQKHFELRAKMVAGHMGKDVERIGGYVKQNSMFDFGHKA
ncbi:hypothetical protein OQA88_1819 [Cercophora sp. LCS_1]